MSGEESSSREKGLTKKSELCMIKMKLEYNKEAYVC